MSNILNVTKVFDVGIDTSPETYNGGHKIYSRLEIDYVEKTYTIYPPKIYRIQTNCKLALHIAESIKLAYELAMEELYKIE